jgi:hypothetical protein
MSHAWNATPIPPRRRAPRLPAVAILLLVALPLPAAGVAAPALSGSAGYDYYAGPSDQTTRSFSGVGAADFGRFNSSLALTRFDDSEAGRGWSVTGAGAASLGGPTWLHGMATRYIGDATYRAWRLKVGPSFDLAGGSSLGIYFAHYSDDSSNTSNSAIAEFGMPLGANLIGRAAGSYGRAQDQGSGQASVGATWTPAHHLELSADLGVAQAGSGAAGAFPSSKKVKKTAGPSTSTSIPASGTAEVAVRFTFP